MREAMVRHPSASQEIRAIRSSLRKLWQIAHRCKLNAWQVSGDLIGSLSHEALALWLVLLLLGPSTEPPWACKQVAHRGATCR